MIGTTGTDEVWARDEGLNRIKIFPRDENATGSEFTEVKFTWLKNFESKFNPELANDEQKTVKFYILHLLKRHLEESTIDVGQKDQVKRRVEKRKPASRKERKAASREKRKAVSDKKEKRLPRDKRIEAAEHDAERCSNSVHEDGIDDDEIVAQYEKSDHVPDKKSAERIGRAKGRIDLDGTPIPAEVIMEIKETALRGSLSPWFVWAYCRFVRSLPNPPRPPRAAPSSISNSQPDPGAQLFQAVEDLLKERESLPTFEEALAAYAGLFTLTTGED